LATVCQTAMTPCLYINRKETRHINKCSSALPSWKVAWVPITVIFWFQAKN
jgi:hypothetical protein